MADEGDGNGGGVLSNFPGDFPGPGQERIRCQYFLHEASGEGLLGLEHAPGVGPLQGLADAHDPWEEVA